MKNLTILFLLITSVAFAQEKNFLDRPYLETSGQVDTLVMPDRIYLSILLKESDSKGKKDIGNLEILMNQRLKALSIDTKKDLTLQDLGSNFQKYFLKGQEVLKSKAYFLLVRDAVTAGKVIATLEEAGISNIMLYRTEYSKEKELKLYLKAKAVKNAKQQADILAGAVQQKVGKALHITDTTVGILSSLQGRVAGLNIRGAASISQTPEPIDIDFEKIKYEMSVSVKFSLE